MTHHYELGLLSDDDRREFELHLLECEYCFESAQRFLQVADHMRRSPKVRESFRKIAEDQSKDPDVASGDEAHPVSEKKQWSRLIPAFAFVTVILLILLFQPWQVEFRPTEEAIADENRVAIMYFDNLVDVDDPQKLGEIVTNLLITDLSESDYRVVSSQRLYDIVKLLGREGAKTVDRDLASQIAKEARAAWMLTGRILQVHPELVITSQLVEVSTGDAIASQRVFGQTGESIFSAADKLTVEVRNDLSLPTGAPPVRDRDVAEVTTHSPEAYRLYLDGVDSYRMYYFAEAARSFEGALRFDSTFAMAYYYLAQLTDGNLISKATEYSYKASTRERGYIRSLAALAAGDRDKAIAELNELTERYPYEKTAYYLLGRYTRVSRNFEESIGYLNTAIRIDPLYKDAYNQLAYVYDEIGDFEKSIWAIDEYISLAPDEANPYDSRGDICASNGRLDQAIESYRSALEIRPDFHYSLQKIGHMLLFKGDYAEADSSYRALIASSDKLAHSRIRSNLALIPLRQGRFKQALHVLDSVVASDSSYKGSEVRLRALILEGSNYLKQAIEMLEDDLEGNSSAQTNRDIGIRSVYIRLLARYGDFAGAENAAEDLSRRLEETGMPMISNWYAAGSIEFYRGNFEAAVELLEKAVDDTEREPCFAVPFMLGRAYLESGRLGDAAATFEEQLANYNYWRLYWGVWNVEARYYLGRAYEESGLNNKAIEQYEEFLDIWQEADPGIESIYDASERMARLKNSP
jgi:tetratricopeptide (TPR) repeat protein